MSESVSFERYDNEFNLLLQQIEKGLNDEPPSMYSSNLFQQADDLIKQMALEARSVSDTSLKRDLLNQVRNVKGKLASLQSQADKYSLLSGGNRNGDNQRYTLIQQQQQTENMLGNQNDTLERARRTMADTETIALEITEELGNNREKLMSAHDRVREVSGLTGRAKKILVSMNQRSMKQKMILYSVAIGLCLGFLILLYAMWG